MRHQQNWSQAPPFMHSFLMTSQVSSGFSTKNQCWQTCISLLFVTFIWSQRCPCPRAENRTSAKLRTGCEGKRPGRYRIGWKKTTGKPEERDHRVEETRMDKRQPLENLESQAWRESPQLLGLCFPVNMWKNSMSVFQVAGLIKNCFQCYPLSHYFKWEVSARI